MRRKITPFARRVLRWYSVHARRLPWRRRFDPYETWVSEVMLQQTRVEVVIPYFSRWKNRFPTVRAVAQASEREVLKLWEGLGYYSRARNLQHAARIVVAKFGGKLPSDTLTLQSLPGIGPYTAGAISSIAFGCHEPAVDANIRRVLSRVFNLARAADSPAGNRILWGLAHANLPKGRAGHFNQALMDLGALVCLPKVPHCELCPAANCCAARRLGLQQQRPVLAARRPAPLHSVSAAVIRRRGRVLIARRPANGLLGGMWEFPNVTLTTGGRRTRRDDGFAGELHRAYGLKVRPLERLGTIHHAYSHFKVTVEALNCELHARSANQSLRWVNVRDLGSFPMGKVDRQIALRLSA
jgi:A/G-specific adenine glycosylase